MDEISKLTKQYKQLYNACKKRGWTKTRIYELRKIKDKVEFLTGKRQLKI